MADPTHPIPGTLHIDASDVAVKDITPEQIQKLTKVRDGFEDAVSEVLNLKQEDIERAGLNPIEIKRLGAIFADDKRIGEVLPAADKMAELLHEARYQRRHEIGTLLAEMAAHVRRRAERVDNGAEVLGPLAQLLDYQYGPGAKASATKEKEKEKAKATAGGGTPGGGTPGG